MGKMSSFLQVVMNLSCGILLFTSVGCATFHFPFGKKIPKATAGDPVSQILCLWQQAEGRDPEGMPCRGFSGQILFLSSRTATPIAMDGDVRIYLFDDQGTEDEQTKPLRQFDFDNGSWAVHLAETTLGPTYTVFVPYVRRGVKEANCALRVRVKPKFGSQVFSDLTNMTLNGNNPRKKTGSDDEATPIMPDEVDRFAAESLTGKLKRTATISLSPNPKATESFARALPETNPGQIQLAAHQVVSESKKESADAERIRRLEAMVQQMMENKSASKEEANAPDASNPAHRKANRMAQDEFENDADASVSKPREPRQLPVRTDDPTELQQVTPRRSAHPLDDDMPSTRRSKSVDKLASEPAIGNPFESWDD